MAKNAPKGDNRRMGAVRQRTQFWNPHIERWVKRDSETGRIMDLKHDENAFKGVRRER